MDQRLHHVRASRPWRYTLANIIPLPSSTLHCSHLRMQSLSITPIHSQLCIALVQQLRHIQARGIASSSTRSSCCTTLIGTRWHTRKETYSASPILKVVCHQIMPPRPMVPYTLHVDRIWPCCLPKSVWACAFLRFILHQHGGVVDAHLRSRHRCSNSKLPSHMLPVRTPRYVQR